MNPNDNPDLFDSFTLAGVRSPGVCTFDFPKREKKFTTIASPGFVGASSSHVATLPSKFSVSILLGNIASAVDEWAAWEAFKPILDATPAQTKKTVGTGLPDDAALADYERQRARAKASLTGTELTSRLADLDAQFQAVVTQAERARALASQVQGLDIYHPQLAGLKPPIVSVNVVGWTEPQPDGKGGGVVKIDFEENRPPTPTAGGTVAGSKSGGYSPRSKGFGPDPNQDLKDEAAALTAEFKAP